MPFRDQVREFIISNFLFGDSGNLTNTTSLLKAGIIDSTGIIEIVQYIENTFDFSVDDDELLPENLDSIEAIGKFIEKKKS